VVDDWQRIHDQVEREFACDHAGAEKRRRVLTSGQVRVERQCPRCGHSLGAVKRHPLESAPASALPDYDEDLQRQWWERRSARQQALMQASRQRESAQWWAQYEAYLLTPAWQDRRRRVLERDGRVCQGCLGRSGLPATQAHHLTYEHVGAEFLWELVAVCTECHRRLHPDRLEEDVS
jgi:5-methylcytosine-specific restriction endonuclease McrA